MGYEKQTWEDFVLGVQEGTLVDALHMNHMEDGIKQNSDDIEAINEKLEKKVGATAGVLDGKLQANPTAMAALGEAELRDAIVSDSDLQAGTSPLATGVIYLFYT